MKSRILPALLLLFILPASASAFPTHCPEHFLGGQAPDLINHRLAIRAKEVCFRGYAVLHSGTTRTPIFSAERLTAENVAAARGTERNDDFHAESRLPAGQRAEPNDYRGSGYDRGHMTPNSDLGDQDEEEETFSLANIVPQNPVSNRGLWSEVETAVRALAERDGVVWVITGPIFTESTPQLINGRVRVPDQLFKAIFDPHTGTAGAYIAENGPNRSWRSTPITELSTLTGVDVFPALSPEVKAAGMPLPAPQRRQQKSER